MDQTSSLQRGGRPQHRSGGLPCRRASSRAAIHTGRGTCAESRMAGWGLFLGGPRGANSLDPWHARSGRCHDARLASQPGTPRRSRGLRRRKDRDSDATLNWWGPHGLTHRWARGS